MSVPNTMRAGPFVSVVLVKKRYLMFYFIIIWASLIPILLEFWVYWQLLFDYVRPVHFFFFLPLALLIMYFSLVFTSLFFSKLLLLIVNKIHKPKEGVFLRDPSDKDYRYWSIRNVIKRWPIWIAHKFPFPFMDNFCFKMFGVKTGFHNSLFEGWVDTEFIEFGKNVVIGQASLVQSTLIVGNLLIIRKTKIGNNVRIGTHCVIMPGTQMGDESVLSSWSCTHVGQELKQGWIYVGNPAHELKKNRFFEDGLKDILGKVEDEEELHKKFEKVYEKRYYMDLSHKERKQIKKEKKEDEKRRWTTVAKN